MPAARTPSSLLIRIRYGAGACPCTAPSGARRASARTNEKRMRARRMPASVSDRCGTLASEEPDDRPREQGEQGNRHERREQRGDGGDQRPNQGDDDDQADERTDDQPEEAAANPEDQSQDATEQPEDHADD